MARLVASPSARALVGYLTLLVLCMACQKLRAQQATPDGMAEIAFDLPAQPLKQALAQYDRLTSLSVFFPSELVEGRSSAPVHGRYRPEDALRRLVEGTGLAVQAAASDAFVLVPAPRPPDAPAPDATTSRQRQIDGAVQARIYRALCARPSLAFGEYRLALRVRIDASGHVRQVRLLDTTGDKARDAAIVETLEQVDVGLSPTDPSRPFVLLVHPVHCDARAAQAGACRPACERQAG